MGIEIQISLGLLPLILFCGIASIIRKKGRIRNIIITAALLILVGVFSLPALVKPVFSGTVASYDDLKLVYAIAKGGSHELAKTFFEDLQSDYKPEYTLCNARLAAESGDYLSAKALYLKAMQSFPEAENEYNNIQTLLEAEDEYYGISDTQEAGGAYQKRAEALSEMSKSLSKAYKSLSDDSNDGLYSQIAQYVINADGYHKAYLYGEPYEISDVGKQLRKFDTFLEENPELSKITQIRLARLKLQILCGKYKAIAQNVNADSDYNELLIVSELYLNKYIKQSDFDGDFSTENTAKYEAVYDKLNDIYSNSYQDKPREERNAAKALIKTLKTVIKNPALGKIEQQLSEYVGQSYSLDASKAYLQMAKIEHSLGNDPKVPEYIDRSIDTVGDCEDSDYTVPMYELVGIIAAKDDPERLKGAAAYVDQVLENNMTIKLADQNNNLPEDFEEDHSVPDESADAGTSLAGDFASQMRTYVNQKRMSVKIVNVDTTGFEKDNTVKAKVNISNNLYTTADELKAALSVNDCGVDISDFTVEKVNYTGANMLLCLDVSGSMQDYDKIGKLRNAVKLFVEEKAGIEHIAIVMFNNGITAEYPFGISVDELLTAADSMYANGGTDMYHALIDSIPRFTKNAGEINSIILMSDGLDNYPASIEDIQDKIAKPCKADGITIYSIGFGSDADTSYLNSFASETGGGYLYADDPDSTSQTNQLSAFFEGLRAQILNQYIITFKAVDTLSYSRELKISAGDGLDSDKVTYYLGGGKDSMTEPDFDEDSPVYMAGKAVYGFSPNLLFRNGQTMNTVLKGEGFDKNDSIGIALKGKSTGVEWDLGASFTDSNSYAVTIPAGIGVDVYDTYITINGKRAIIPKGLCIVTQGSEKVTDYGQYRFVSYIKQEDKQKNEITLSGAVTMNGWLNFNDAITLYGDLKGDSITLSDWGGSCVRYDEQNGEGLAKVLAKIGLPVMIPAFGEITLHNGSEDSNGDVRVEVFPLNALDLGKYFGFGQIDVKLYPNRAQFKASSITANLPFANKVLKNSNANFFSIDATVGVTVSSKKIGCSPLDIKYGASNNQKDTFSPVGFGNMPIYISPQSFSLHIDTIANDYSFDFSIRLGFVAGQNPFGLHMRWNNPDSGNALNSHSNGLFPTEVRVDLPFGKIKTVVAGIPITYDKFMVGIEDIDTSKSPIYWTLVGGMDVSAAKLSAIPVIGGLADWIGDVSVLKLDKAKLSLNLGEQYIKAETGIKLFEELDLGNLKIEIGKFSYKCELLGMNNEPVAGFLAKATFGPNWKFGESSLKMQITGELDILTKFIGLQGKGDLDANLKVWIISIGVHKTGEIALGVRITSDGTTAFVIRTNPDIINLTWPKNAAGKL